MKKFNLRKKILALTLTVITMFSTVAGLLPGGVVHAAGATSGTYYGIDWELDTDGNLTLKEGTCTNTKGTKFGYVKTVKCDGNIVCNNKFCVKLFNGYINLISADLSGFDTSNVTSMKNMFYDCKKLTSLNLSSFNTSKVTSMDGMFEGCGSLTSLDLSSFDTSNVTTMYNMFFTCYKLASLDVSNFNTSNVTNMIGMFSYCKALTELDLSNFSTSKVTMMGSMFANCTSLTTLDISNFNTSSITDMESMFENCSSLKSLDLSSFDTYNVKRMDCMFYDCTSLTSLDLSNFNTNNVTNMGGMFVNCTGLTTLDLSSFDTSNVTSITGMFRGCTNLTSLNLSNFDISKVTSSTNIFADCNSLKVLTTPKTVGTTNIPLPFTMYDDSNNTYNKLVGNNVVLYSSPRPNVYYGIEWQLDAEGNLTLKGGTCNNTQGTKWNSTDVKTVKCDGEIVCNDYFCKGLFSRHSNLVSADLSGFNTNNVTNMSNMFAYCSALTTLDISNFNTSNVTSMESMFKNCSSLESLDLSNFNTSNVTNMGSMFEGCSSLKLLDLSSFDMSSCSAIYFINATTSLETLKTPKVKPQDRVVLPYHMYDNEKKTYYDALDVENVTLQRVPAYPREETVIHTIDFFHTPLFNIQMALNGTPNNVFADDEDFLKNTSAFCLLDSTSDNYGNSEYNIPGIVATEQGKEFMLSSLKPYTNEDELNAYEQYTVVINKSDIKIDYITKLVDENGSVIQTLPEGKCYIQVTINYNGVEYKAFVGYNDPEVYNLLPNNVESTTTDSIEASYDENNNLVVKANQTDTYTSGKKVTKTVDIDTYGVTDQGTTLLITYDGASTEIEKIVNIEGTLLYNDGTPVQKKVVKLSTPKDMFDISSDKGHYEFLSVPLTNNVMPLSVFDTDDTSACSDNILLTSGVVTFDNTGLPLLDNDPSKEMTLVIEKVTPTVPEREEVVVPTPEVVPTPKPSTTTTIVVPGPIVDNTNSVVPDSVVDNTNIVNLPNVVAATPGENTQSDVIKVDNTVNKNILSEKSKQNNEKITDFSKNRDKDNKKIDANNKKPSEEKDTTANSIKENKSSQKDADMIMGISFLLVLILVAIIVMIIRSKSKKEQ